MPEQRDRVPRDEDAALLWAYLAEAPPSVREHRPELPARLDDIIATAMAEAPDDRCGTCRELAAAVQAQVDGADGSAAGPVAWRPPPAVDEAAPAEDAARPEPEWAPAEDGADWSPSADAPMEEPVGRVEEPEEPVRAPPEGPPYAPVLAEAGPAATRPRRITSPSGCGRFVALLAAVVVAAVPAVLLFHGSQRNRLTVTEAVTPLSPSSTRAPGAGSRPASTSCSRRRPRVDRALQREGHRRQLDPGPRAGRRQGGNAVGWPPRSPAPWSMWRR